jgi:hypothetical protein
MKVKTMHTFVFRFGYCTPLQLQGSEAHGWDDESSSAFVVRAESSADALHWGQKVADAFVAQLFAESGRVQSTTWSDANFANWIEENPSAVFSDAELAALPVVAFGEMPDVSSWR